MAESSQGEETKKEKRPPCMRPYGRHILICAHGDCAPSEDGRSLEQIFRAVLGKRRRLRNPERVKVSIADCLGVCEGGPIVAVYPDGVWYHHVTPELAREIAQQHLLQERPVESAIFHRLYPRENSPAYPPSVRGDAGTYREEDGLEALSAAEEGSTADPMPEIKNKDEQHAEQKMAKRERRIKKGLVIVNTGNGKGKTTSSLGIITRSWGRGLRVAMVQFMKHEGARFGEARAAEKMGITWLGSGDGWTWTSKDLDESAERARHGWQRAQEMITSEHYDVIILDEFTYPLHFGWINVKEVIDWMRAYKPRMLHIVITGRYAPPALIDFADLVTEMREIKHPFTLQGIRAQPGIEF